MRTVAGHGGGLAVGGGRIIDDIDPFAWPDETETLLLEGVPFAAWQVGAEFRRVGRRFDFQLFAEIDGVVAKGAAFADVSRVLCPFDEILHAFFSVRQEEDVFWFGVLETDEADAGDVAFDGAQVYAKTRFADADKIFRLPADGGFSFVETLPAVAAPTLLYSASTKTLGYELYEYWTFTSQPMACAMAFAILMIVVVLNFVLNKLTKGELSI